MAELFAYHCVIRPPLEDLPTWDDTLQVIKDMKDLVWYCIGSEKGSSKGDETFNHYDMVLYINKNRRVDALKLTLCDQLKIAKDKRRNCKVFSIDDDRLDYQTGYCLKECLGSKTNMPNEMLDKGRACYERIGPLSKEKFSEDKWDIDMIAEKYEKFLREQNKDDKKFLIDEAEVERWWKKWKNANKKNIKFSVFQKINKDKLKEYISDI